MPVNSNGLIPPTAKAWRTWILTGFGDVDDHVARQGPVVQINGLILQVDADPPGPALERALLVEVEHEAAALLAAKGALDLRVAVSVGERLRLRVVEGLQVPHARRRRGGLRRRRGRPANRQRRLQLRVTATRGAAANAKEGEGGDTLSSCHRGAVNGSVEAAGTHLKPTSCCMTTEGRGLDCARSEALFEAGKGRRVRSAVAGGMHCAESPRTAKTPRKCVD